MLKNKLYLSPSIENIGSVNVQEDKMFQKSFSEILKNFNDIKVYLYLEKNSVFNEIKFLKNELIE